jgi:CRISPR-associated protein Cas1
MQDLHELPKLRDSLSYLYVEHAILDRKDSAIEFINKEGRTLVPVAALCVLMLGPGTSITHAAIKVLAEAGCSTLWTGEEFMRYYAQGMGETRKAYHLLRQAELVSDPHQRMHVVRRMYQKRFDWDLDPTLSIEQIRGLEGVRVRETYSEASRKYKVPWEGRKYDRQNWGAGDPINRALSSSNALLNGVCHAGIVSGGYSPGLGFIHTGKQLSFVYDLADLYKAELTIPTAFQIVGEASGNVERRVRMACREKFKEARLLDRILPDIDELLGIQMEALAGAFSETGDVDADPALPEVLWSPPESVGPEATP